LTILQWKKQRHIFSALSQRFIRLFFCFTFNVVFFYGRIDCLLFCFFSKFERKECWFFFSVPHFSLTPFSHKKNKTCPMWPFDIDFSRSFRKFSTFEIFSYFILLESLNESFDKEFEEEWFRRLWAIRVALIDEKVGWIGEWGSSWLPKDPFNLSNSA